MCLLSNLPLIISFVVMLNDWFCAENLTKNCYYELEPADSFFFFFFECL